MRRKKNMKKKTISLILLHGFSICFNILNPSMIEECNPKPVQNSLKKHWQCLQNLRNSYEDLDKHWQHSTFNMRYKLIKGFIKGPIHDKNIKATNKRCRRSSSL